MHSAPTVSLVSRPVCILFPQLGAAAVRFTLECGSFRADIVIIVLPHTWSIGRKYSRRNWVM